MKLYDFELSAECYQARLMLSALGLDYERADVEYFPSGEHTSAWYTRISPMQQLPALQDGDRVLSGPHPVLVHLATTYDRERTWCPPDRLAQVVTWLGFGTAFAASGGAARLHASLFHLTDVEAARREAHRLLRVLEDHLWFAEAEGDRWLCGGEHPTIADLAVFPEVVLSEEGGVSRIDYPAVRRWTDRVKRIPGFVAMSGTFPTSPEAPVRAPIVVEAAASPD